MADAVPTPRDRAHFLAATRRHGNSVVHRRINALLPLDDGWTAKRVAGAPFIGAETARAHRRLHVAGGRAGAERLACAGHAPVLSETQAAGLPAGLAIRGFCAGSGRRKAELAPFLTGRFRLNGHEPAPVSAAHEVCQRPKVLARWRQLSLPPDVGRKPPACLASRHSARRPSGRSDRLDEPVRR